MSDLIDRQALLKQIEIDSEGCKGSYGDCWEFMDTINNMPSAEPQERKTSTDTADSVITASTKITVRRKW